MYSPASKRIDAQSAQCTLCPAGPIALYAALETKNRDALVELRREVREVKARTPLFWAGRGSRDIITLKRGWAFSFKLLSDGRRQILDFFVGGDMIGLPLVLEESLPYGVHTITPSQVCIFDRDAFRGFARKVPEMELLLFKSCLNHHHELDDRIVDLGRRNAMERLCRLILNIREKTVTRNLGSGDVFDFPLRQHHIADYLGLTSVHTARLMTELLERSIARISDRRMKIINFEALSELAGLPSPSNGPETSNAG